VTHEEVGSIVNEILYVSWTRKNTLIIL